MLYSYKSEQTSICLNSQPVIFIGDSVTRTLFFQFARIIDPSLPNEPPNDTQKHSDYLLRSKGGSDISFFWDPFLNTSRTLDVIQPARNDTSAVKRPALLVLGSGLWYLRYATTSGGLAAWEANMEHILDILARGLEKPADEVIVLPIEQVVTSKLSPERAMSMHSSDIDAMNSDLFHRINPPTQDAFPLLSNAKPSLPVSLPLVFNQMLDPSQTKDGLHFSDSLVKIQATILLNLKCNDVLPKRFPLDKTCCSKYPWPSILQFIVLGLAVIWGPAWYFLWYQKGTGKDPFSKSHLSMLTSYI